METVDSGGLLLLSGQLVQLSAVSDDALYCPAVHWEQAPVEDDLPNPALHLQSVSYHCPPLLLVLVLLGHGEQDCAPFEAESWYVLARQLSQVVGPVEPLYWPFGHAAQVEPDGPVKPELQVQAVEACDADGLLLLSGQLVQLLSAI